MNARRRELLNELRARQTRAWAERTPLERLERADELRQFAGQIRGVSTCTDEPLELLAHLARRRRSRGRA